MQAAAFWSAAACYAVAAVLFARQVARRAELRGATAIAALGLGPHALAIGSRWADAGHGPFSVRHEVLSANAFLLVAVFLVATLLARGFASLGAFVLPIAVVLLGFAVPTIDVTNELPVIFKSSWLYLHMGFGKLYGAAAVLAAACGATYLLAERHPSTFARMPLPRLDAYGHRLLLVSFTALGAMIVAGSLWAHRSWGRYWAWDPIETSAFATWLALGVILHFRVLHGWNGHRMAWLNLLALVPMVMTVYVVVLVTPTIHDFYLVGPR